jgi:transposase
LGIARRSLPLYSHRYSPKTFTLHQLFACLVLKSFLKTDYRGVVAHLNDCPDLAAVLQLKRVPHFTTLQKRASKLLSSAPARRLLHASVRQHMRRKRRVRSAAVDSTGLECTCASGYFIRRRERVGKPWKSVQYHHFAKLSVVCDVTDHFVLAFRAGRGPKPDVAEFRSLLSDALSCVRLSRIVADAGYDSEANHSFARDDCHVRTIIPARHGRPTAKLPSGYYRRLMKTRFDTETYHERAQVETVMSMIKRRQGAYVRGISHHSQVRDLRLIALTHNVMILLRIQVFYRACQEPFVRSILRTVPAKGS